jgi:hypothetical protein
LAQVVKIFILDQSHIFSVDPSFYFYDHLAFGTFDFVKLLVNWMKKPFLVQVSIVVVHDQLFIDLVALSRDVDVFGRISQRLNPEVLSNKVDLEVLFG